MFKKILSRMLCSTAYQIIALKVYRLNKRGDTVALNAVK